MVRKADRSISGKGSLGNEKLGIGAQGVYPRGKITPDDKGLLAVAMTTNKEKGIIMIDFGTSISWIGLTPDDARALAKALIERSDELEE